MTNFVLKIAESIGSMGVKSAYGEPIDVDGVTIVPVALVQFGFGGGEDSEAEGSGPVGGGGGGMAVPIGAYVTENGKARFEPNLIALLTVGIPFVWVAGHTLSRVIRALKK
ncbi:spore germination protein GerW family protein [Glaciibacter psychrotolerans]|uniref:Putative spore protein YtfJ n=1 Tax=Glaciibacter psychrotolerans TaxID=670054 RepID=A0A7Z0EEC7_9MICO|nr:spore germination protein GerW family protein [Leifsonia psychrotolerans]NYJ19394.1 putative spore protein YtfJ [Leifsonia psychrotolerans]